MKRLAVMGLSVALSGCFLSAKELQVESRILPSLVPMAPQYAMPTPANVFNGTGGTRRMLVSHTSAKEGVNLWVHGTPPCTYEVLDVVTDRRGAGTLSMQSMESDMIREVSARGGTDVLILERGFEEEERPPIYTVAADGRGPQTVMAPVKISNTRYAIARCLDRPSPGHAPQFQSQPQPQMYPQGVMHYQELPQYKSKNLTKW